MRLGQNPAKAIDQVPQPERVTVAIVSYIPFLSGYYAESLQVLQTCLNSLWENTPRPYDLLIFDNASCAEVRDYLSQAHQQGRIQYLVLSDRNVGKGGAWNFIFQGAPGEVIAYADSDVYFFPGWLEVSLKVLDTFPKTGMVSSRPLRTPEKFFTSTLEWTRQISDSGRTPDTADHATLEQGQFMSWEVFKEHNDSLGVSTELAQEWFNSSHDWRIGYQDQVVYAGAAHFQFLAPKSVLQQVVPFKMDRPMGQVRAIDQLLNDLGYLRLNTSQPYVKHLGNSLSSPLETTLQTDTKRSSLARQLLDFSPVRRTLLRLYDKIFRWYYAR